MWQGCARGVSARGAVRTSMSQGALTESVLRASSSALIARIASAFCLLASARAICSWVSGAGGRKITTVCSSSRARFVRTYVHVSLPAAWRRVNVDHVS